VTILRGSFLMNNVDCPDCGQDMPAGRTEWYNVCADCNDEQPVAGLMVYDHKTAGRLEVFNPNNPHDRELMRQADRFNERAR
jgi:anaerobic ribonucleoside-triphosphate reductase